MAAKQTAGRDALGKFASKFAELNDDVLFGQVWSREDKLSLRDRSIVTVVALMAQGLTDSSFQYHLQSAKNNGVAKAEIAEILTHAAFYAGWPKAWAAFRMAKEVWAEDDVADDAKAAHESQMVFPIGVELSRKVESESARMIRLRRIAALSTTLHPASAESRAALAVAEPYTLDTAEARCYPISGGVGHGSLQILPAVHQRRKSVIDGCDPP